MPENASKGDERRSGVIGERERLDGSVHLAPYDPKWPSMFSKLATFVHSALGDRVLQLEHVGSTSIEGLSAKPIIDMVLAVKDPRNESEYVPDLVAYGFVLRRREPGWFEHRLFRHYEPRANLHVFPVGCPEIDRMLVFRDRLRSHSGDRKLYEETKKELASKRWDYVQDYADAKADIVREILARGRE